MKYNYSITHDYWIVFKSGEGYWLQKFLKAGFGHALIITKDEYNWMVLDPHKLCLSFNIAPYKASQDVPRLLAKDGYTVLKLTFFDRCTKTKTRHSRLNNCVSFVKYALGLKLKSLTPYALFKKLLRLNEREKFKNGIRTVNIVY